MTTIVYCHKTKQIACDSRVVEDNQIISDDYNKWHPKAGRQYFMAGATGDYPQFTTCHVEEELPIHTLECRALMIKDSEVFLVVLLRKENQFYEELLEYNYSIGSGSAFALAALDFGKSVEEAVQYAATRDSSTGGKVRVYNITN